jgi:hypothetical protein
MTDPRTLSGALWMLCAETRAAARAGVPISPDRALSLSVMLGNLAQTAQHMEHAASEDLADTLAAIEREAARGVVVRFPARAHCDAVNGDAGVA